QLFDPIADALGEALEVLYQYFAVIKVDLRTVRAKQGSKRCTKTHPIESTAYSRDMLTKSIKEVLWKTVLASGCFCFHNQKTIHSGRSFSTLSIDHCASRYRCRTGRYSDIGSFVVVADFGVSFYEAGCQALPHKKRLF